MGKREKYEHGTFSWAELSTTDVGGAKSFYGELFGWDIQDLPAGEGITYTMFFKDGSPAAACAEQMPAQREQGMPPNWLTYISVDDVDATTAKAKEVGGNAIAEPFDVLDSGRMSLVADAEGAVFGLWQAGNHIGAGVVNEPGGMCWNELKTNDAAKAKQFYTDLFGWGSQSMDMGNGQEYTIVKVGERSNGGIIPMTGMPGMEGVPAHWSVYFGIDDVDKGVERAEALGGKLLYPPMDVPMGRFAAVADPQGTPFSIWAGQFDD